MWGVVSTSDYLSSNGKIYWKRSGGKRSVRFRCFPGICLNVLVNTTKDLSQDNLLSGWDSNGIYLGHKSERLPLKRNLESRCHLLKWNSEKCPYIISAGYSEDSDYTSDLNYPVGQHANSSASQFRNAAHQMCTPQRSLETSRENSYERDDVPQGQGQGHYYGGDTGRRYSDNESEPLYYNSRPKNYKEYNRCANYICNTNILQ